MTKAHSTPSAPLREAPWLVYGPAGVTGRLVVEEALRRGHRPLLAGRGESVHRMACAYGLEACVVSLDQRDALHALLRRASRVLLVAGPFADTAEPMLAACLATSTPYLDMSGEVDSVLALLRLDAAAKEKGVALIAGAGFGVTAGECLALHTVRMLPTANALRIGVAADNGHQSRGALMSTIDVLGRGGAYIHGGRLVRGTMGHEHFRAQDGRRSNAIIAAPMAEAVAAHHSTGVLDVVAGRRVPRFTAPLLALMAPVLHVVARNAVLKRVAAAVLNLRPPAATEGRRSWAWAEARAGGQRHAAVLEMGEGYAFAAQAMVRAAERLAELSAGAFTPASAYGPDFVLDLDMVTRRDIDGPGGRP